MVDDEDDDIPEMGDLPEEAQEHIRSLLRAGKIEFAPEALASIKAKGLTEDEVVAMIMRSAGLQQ